MSTSKKLTPSEKDTLSRLLALIPKLPESSQNYILGYGTAILETGAAKDG